MVVYLALLIVGAGVLTLGLLLGHGAEGTGDLAHDPGGASPGALLSVRSLAFGAFAAGLTGVLGLLLHASEGLPLALVAVFTALVAALGTALAMRWLRLRSPNANVASADLVGLSARVLVPPSRAERGKVRVMVRGSVTDLLASTDDEGLSAGDTVLVVGSDGPVVHVAKP